MVRAFGNHHLYLDIKTSYSILSLSANLPFALTHSALSRATQSYLIIVTLGNIIKEIVITQELNAQPMAFGAISPY